EEDITALSRQLQEEHADTNSGVTFRFQSVYDLVTGDIRPALLILLVGVGLVLLIACANVANLLLGVAAVRAREVAVRLAMGAERNRLVRQFMTESVVLGVIGAGAGLVLAWWLVWLIPGLPIDLPRATEISLDAPVLVFAAGMALLTSVIFGLAPALHGTRWEVSDVLREGDRGDTGGRRGGRLRSVLVVAEVTLALIVLVSAGLLVQSLVRVVNQDIGFEADDLVSANVGLFYFEEPARQAATLQRVLEELSTIPGVERVAGGSGLPPQTAQRATGFEVAGLEADDADPSAAPWLAVTPGYFETIGSRVIRGREFNGFDATTSAPVALISESLARVLFADADPLGRQLRLTNSDAEPVLRTIVGVVEDVRYQGVENPFTAAIYTPFAQTPFLWAYLMIRSQVPATQLAHTVREAIGRIDARLVPARVRQHRDVVSDLVARRRLITSLLSAFAGLAVILAAVGIYGVIAYGVAQRRREIGVRLAMGARRAQVIREVVSRALRVASIGIALGLVASFWLTRLLGTMLYTVQATDPITFALAAGVIAGVAGLAGTIPAVRAAAVDPATVLRN
ncbi:MAG: FtsX-like permease family protein, partial [Gemmatimonadetes bacterium]|nr:FtsX-like permease family protein [Gemmatimonadota bacterium]